MYIQKVNGQQLFVKVLDYTPTILINFELIQTTSQKFRSVDRGSSTDSYSCEFIFRGKKDYIKSIIECLEDLRMAKLPVVLSGLEEPFFGHNVVSTGNLTGVVLEMGKTMSPMLNVQEVSVKIVLDTSTLSFTGSASLPSSLNYLQSKYDTYNEWSTIVNQTYTRSLYFVDRRSDKYVFTGTYSMNNTDLTNMLAFQKYIRGQEFSISESLFGTHHMFGYATDDTNHRVVLQTLTYERLSAIRSLVTITLIKVG